MKIELSREEYRDLLDVLHMAEWVMHAHETEDDPSTEAYDRILQKFYAFAKDVGYADLIEYDPERKEYFETREFDETTAAWAYIDDFTEDTFWDELIHRLTDRDAARSFGGYEQLDKMDMKERFSVETPIIERYSREFEERGLDRLEIVEPFSQANGKRPVTHD